MNCIFGTLPFTTEEISRQVMARLRPLSKTDASLRRWTAAVKDAFGTLAAQYGCKPLYTNTDPKCSEFMLDLVWWDEDKEAAVLGLECEWGSQFDFRNADRFKHVINSVAEDFWKLLVFKAPLKVLVYTTISPETRITLHNRLLADISRYSQHVEGETYLLLEFSVKGECCAFAYVVDKDGSVCQPQLQPLDAESRLAIQEC